MGRPNRTPRGPERATGRCCCCFRRCRRLCASPWLISFGPAPSNNKFVSARPSQQRRPARAPHAIQQNTRAPRARPIQHFSIWPAGRRACCSRDAGQLAPGRVAYGLAAGRPGSHATGPIWAPIVVGAPSGLARRAFLAAGRPFSCPWLRARAMRRPQRTTTAAANFRVVARPLSAPPSLEAGGASAAR